ncbi:MAG: hypothetical protein ACE5JX_20510 [Acidobacteriota bacterium]
MLTLLALSLLTPSSSIPTGQVLERMVCLADPEQGYTLYLPSNYDAGLQWPLIIALDPGARGVVPARRFSQAAERYGYIVVASNNSRNGPLEPAIKAIGILWQEATQRFSVDRRRVYLTGFSGGARMAVQLAQGSVASGVIACGAGLLKGDPTRLPFLFVGVAGNRDMNHLEVKMLVDNLKTLGTTARFFTFDGKHSWPPPAVLTRAVEWLELKAMEASLKPRNEVFIQTLFQSALDQAEKERQSGDLYQARRSYRDIVSDFGPFLDLEAQRDELEALTGNPTYRHQVQQVEKLEAIERRTIREILDVILGQKPDRKMKWWRKKIASIRALQKDPKDARQRRLARRLIDFVWLNGLEKSWFASKAKEYPRSIYLARVALLVRPESSGLLYHLAKTYALNHQDKRSMETLRKALKAGLDPERARKEAAFSNLADKARFRALVGAEGKGS